MIPRQLYKLGADGILTHCVLEHEILELLQEAHEGTTRGHYVGKVTLQKALHVGLYSPRIFQYTEQYCKECNVCQRVRKPSRCNKIPLQPLITLDPFEKWVVYFVEPITPTMRHIGTHYIITAT